MRAACIIQLSLAFTVAATGCADTRPEPDGDWTFSDDDAATQPTEQYRSVTVGLWQSCAVKEGGDMRCQGSRSLYGSTLPEQPLDEIASGYIHTCATTTEGRLRCWGLGNDRNRDEDAAGKDFDQSIPPDGIFHGLTTGAFYSCALDQTDEIHCWGEGFRPYVMHQPERQRALPGPDLPEGKFRVVAAGFDGGCALPRGPGIDCWGSLERYSEGLEGTFIDLSVSARYFCAIREDHRLSCWGNGSDPERREQADDYDQASPPPGRYEQVSAGLRHACAITTDNRIRCWGQDERQQTSPPKGRYQFVDCGWRNCCAIALNGTVDCWGWGPNL